MVIALNIAALMLVIGISWTGMMWLAGFIHRNSTKDGPSESDDWVRLRTA